MTEEKKKETTFTSIVDGSDIKIVNVQTKPAVLIRPRPLPLVRPVQQGCAGSISVNVEKEVKKLVFTNNIIRTHFKSSQITNLQCSSTELVNSYQVTVVNDKDETTIVDLVQEIGSQITIVNVDYQIPESEIFEIEQEDVKTEVVVESQTGHKVYTTNDQTIIKKDVSIKHVTQNIVAQVPDLVSWVPVNVQTTTYGDTQQTTVEFVSEEKKTTQVTTIVNKKTNKVDVVSTQVVSGTKPLVQHVQVIPKPIIKIASKRFTEIKDVMSTIESSVESSVTFESITVKDLKDVKIITPIISTPSQPGKTEFVFVYDKKTKEVVEIESVKIEEEIKQVYFEKEVTKHNEVIIKSNDIVEIKKERPEINVVLTQIDETYEEKISETVKSVKVVEQEYSTEYQIVTEVQGKTNEVTVIKRDDKFEVLGIEEIETSVVVVEVEEEETTTTTQEETVEITSETGTMVTEVVQTSDIKELQTVEITSIKATESIVSTVYEVETTNENNQVQVVTISVEPKKKPVIVKVKEVTKETEETTSTTVTKTEETKVTKTVSEVTG